MVPVRNLCSVSQKQEKKKASLIAKSHRYITEYITAPLLQQAQGKARREQSPP